MWRRHARKPERTQYAWSSLQMVGKTSDSQPDAAVQSIYTENSDEPLARRLKRLRLQPAESTPVTWDTPQNLRFQGSTWTAKPACTTISTATTTRRTGVTPRWTRLLCWAG